MKLQSVRVLDMNAEIFFLYKDLHFSAIINIYKRKYSMQRIF